MPRVVRTRDVPGGRRAVREGIESGSLLRVAHGVYVDTKAAPSAHRSLVEASVAVPRGVICLLSALRFHDIGTQNPHEVWLAIDVKAWRPRSELPIHIVRFSGRALTYGVEAHEIEGVKVRVTSVAKTVADCFKYRNKIGIDVAVEALRDVRRRKSASIDDIMKAAKICRVANVSAPTWRRSRDEAGDEERGGVRPRAAAQARARREARLPRRPAAIRHRTPASSPHALAAR